MSPIKTAVFLSVLVYLPCHAQTIQVSPGDFCATSYFSNTITHYNRQGAILGSMTVPSGLAEDIKGLAFGPDDLLYAVAERDSGFAVLALDAYGSVHQTYPFGSNYIGGNLSYGKIAFGNDGAFYVGGGAGLVRFDHGNPNSGDLVYGGGVYDVEVLPSGNVLIVTSYDLHELTASGSHVREINPVGTYFTDNRGVEYDSATDTIYVTMLGHTGEFFQIMKLEGSSGQLLDQATFNYADDMILTDDGRLVVGSRTQSPGIFDTDTNYLGSFEGDDRMFVTQYVPEPTTLSLLALGGVALLRRRR